MGFGLEKQPGCFVRWTERRKGDDAGGLQVCQAFRKPDLFTQQIHSFISFSKHILSVHCTQGSDWGPVGIQRWEDMLLAFYVLTVKGIYYSQTTDAKLYLMHKLNGISVRGKWSHMEEVPFELGKGLDFTVGDCCSIRRSDQGTAKWLQQTYNDEQAQTMYRGQWVV